MKSSFRVLLTAGPTREYLDPVRYLSNASSGAMALALSQEARRARAQVTVVAGPIDPSMQKEFLKIGVRLVPVISAREMLRAVMRCLSEVDLFIAAAAVTDYRPERFSRSKIARSSDALEVKLVPNPDIVKTASRSPRRPACVVGFALESKDLRARAQAKLRDKDLDWIIANPPSNIGSSRGSALVLSKSGEQITIGTRSKAALAKQIWKVITATVVKSGPRG